MMKLWQYTTNNQKDTKKEDTDNNDWTSNKKELKAKKSLRK